MVSLLLLCCILSCLFLTAIWQILWLSKNGVLVFDLMVETLFLKKLLYILLILLYMLYMLKVFQCFVCNWRQILLSPSVQIEIQETALLNVLK